MLHRSPLYAVPHCPVAVGSVAILLLAWLALGCAAPSTGPAEPPQVIATVDYAFRGPDTAHPLEPRAVATPTKETPVEVQSEPWPSADSKRGVPVRVIVSADRPFDLSDPSVKPLAAVSRTISNPLREAEVLLVPMLTEGSRVREGGSPNGSVLAKTSLIVGADWNSAVELALTERGDLPVRAVRVELQPTSVDPDSPTASPNTIRVTFTFEALDGGRERVSVIQPVSVEKGAVFRFPRARLAIGLAAETDSEQRDETWSRLEALASEVRSRPPSTPRMIPDPVLEASRRVALHRNA
ncbi:MAG: hypothetical protein AAF488_19595, partial [Planctomycetota bacterium]